MGEASSADGVILWGRNDTEADRPLERTDLGI